MVSVLLTLAVLAKSVPNVGGTSLSGCGTNNRSIAFCNAPAKFEHGVGYPNGGNAGSLSTTDLGVCCCACASTEGCNGWTLNMNEKTCYLKTDAGPATASKGIGVTSAIMPPTPPPPPYIPKYPTPKGAKNVLFLAVDDMRPSIGAYNFSIPGRATSHTPNLDKLASEGLLFSRAYVQYAYCSPSRNSFMSGRRPDTTKVWEFVDHFREEGVGADWVTMPQFFKQYGYLTLGGGKLYHPASQTENVGMPNNDYPASWTPEYPYLIAKEAGAKETLCESQGPFPMPPGSPTHEKFVWCAVDTPKESSLLFDQQVRDGCIDHLELATNGSAGNSSRPFFIGCGFHKPHAPHYAPKEFFDNMPDYTDIPLPHDPFAPIGMPMVAWHPYADVSGMDETPMFNGTVNMTRLKVYRRAYYTSIEYTDYNIGQILNKLDAVGKTDSTIVIVFGDHGYQLGEHDTWAKMTNFELGVHIPLIVRAPWMKNAIGRETSVLAEMVDVFPTLASVAGLPDPKMIEGSTGINGTSLLPVFEDPANTTVKSAAYSQFSKNNIGTNVDPKYPRNATQMMGYSIRTDEWRYTAWFKFDNRTWLPENKYGRIFINESLGTELYDHRGDTGKWLDWPGENRNMVNDSEHASVVEQLHKQILDFIQLPKLS